MCLLDWLVGDWLGVDSEYTYQPSSDPLSPFRPSFLAVSRIDLENSSGSSLRRRREARVVGSADGRRQRGVRTELPLRPRLRLRLRPAPRVSRSRPLARLRVAACTQPPTPTLRRVTIDGTRPLAALGERGTHVTQIRREHMAVTVDFGKRRRQTGSRRTLRCPTARMRRV